MSVTKDADYVLGTLQRRIRVLIALAASALAFAIVATITLLIFQIPPPEWFLSSAGVACILGLYVVVRAWNCLNSCDVARFLVLQGEISSCQQIMEKSHCLSRTLPDFPDIGKGGTS